jgi:SAM domain (Sterile alpha motif)
MQQVPDWLEKLGLGQYAQRFAENDINFVILSDLNRFAVLAKNPKSRYRGGRRHAARYPRPGPFPTPAQAEEFLATG